MKDRDEAERYLPLATSISDGAAVDWGLHDSAASDEMERALLRELMVVSRIAEAHRDRSAEPVPAAIQEWGHLRVLEKVGEGAFGEVYRAWDARLEREVALKLFRAGARASAGATPILVEEGRLLARVRHPNVVTVHGADRIGERIGLWMAFVRGRTLEDLLRRQGPFGAREAALVGLDVSSALAAVHGAGLLHRDIKAQNVMREEGGRILLMDFSAGRDLLAAPAGPEERILSGTPLYMAPELFRGHEATARSDIYSVGVLLYHLVTGSYPVKARSLAELREAHERGGVRLLRDERPDLPKAFVRVVERSLSADPAERFATAGEMEQALAATLGEERGERARAAEPSASTTPWRRIVVGIVAASLATIALLVAWQPLSSLFASTPYTVQATLHRKHGDGTELLAPGARVAPGDELFMEFEASRSLYLYVLNEDEEGQSYLLFPLPGFEPGNPLPAGGPRRLPGTSKGKQVFWQVTSAGGREHFLVVASPERLSEFEAQMLAVARPRPGAPLVAARLTEEAELALRGVGGLVTEETAEPPEKRGAPAGRFFDLAREASAGPESVRGVFVRQISVENPAP